jgi:uncharacterized protein (TIGR03084 family)
MDQIVDALEAQQAELTSLLEGLDGTGWAQPSPCEGWDVADVVLHLVQTNLMAEASLADALDAFYAEQLSGARAVVDVDDGAAAMVEAHRGFPNDELLERWRSGAARIAGLLSARTLATTRLAETWIHTGDVAAALGVELPASDRLEHIARLAWRTLPYAFARAGREAPGPVAFELTGPTGQTWSFQPDSPPSTTVRGPAADLCAVAGRRTDPAATALVAEGPDGAAVLELVRTYA